MPVFQAGLLLGLSLIMSLGPQNVYVLHAAVQRQYAVLAMAICIACDCCLIASSGEGTQRILTQYPDVAQGLTCIGGLFLCYQGGRQLWTVFLQLPFSIPQVVMPARNTARPDIWRVIITAASFSLLNPQAILELCLVVAGSLSDYPASLHPCFLQGLMLASALWFLGLTMTGMMASAVLQRPRIRQWLEGISGSLMVYCGAHLLTG